MMNKSILRSILFVFASPFRAKEQVGDWEHDERRVSKADEKRLRKNAARLRAIKK